MFYPKKARNLIHFSSKEKNHVYFLSLKSKLDLFIVFYFKKGLCRQPAKCKCSWEKKYGHHREWKNCTFNCKLVETFHVVGECKTAVYFCWFLIHALAQPVQLFWPLVTFGVASSNSLTDSDLQRLTETEKYETRHSFIQYKKLFL